MISGEKEYAWLLQELTRLFCFLIEQKPTIFTHKLNDLRVGTELGGGLL